MGPNLELAPHRSPARQAPPRRVPSRNPGHDERMSRGKQIELEIAIVLNRAQSQVAGERH